MTDTSKLDAALMRLIRIKLQEALDPVAAAERLTIKVGNATFDPDAGHFTFKVEGRVAGGLTKEQAAYDVNRKWLNLPPRGSTIKFGRHEYVTTGLRRDHVLVERDGKGYRIKLASLAETLAPQREAA